MTAAAGSDSDSANRCTGFKQRVQQGRRPYQHLTAAVTVQIMALGVTSVFNQILDEMDAGVKAAVFSAYIKSLDEKPETYTEDGRKLADMASACSSPADLKPDADGTDVRSSPLIILAIRPFKTGNNRVLLTPDNTGNNHHMHAAASYAYRRAPCELLFVSALHAGRFWLCAARTA